MEMQRDCYAHFGCNDSTPCDLLSPKPFDIFGGLGLRVSRSFEARRASEGKSEVKYTSRYLRGSDTYPNWGSSKLSMGKLATAGRFRLAEPTTHTPPPHPAPALVSSRARRSRVQNEGSLQGGRCVRFFSPPVEFCNS